jgi:putative transposase
MPSASRCFLPGHVWHITRRCHKNDFLLKFAKDRDHWLHWLFEAMKRFAQLTGSCLTFDMSMCGKM